MPFRWEPGPGALIIPTDPRRRPLIIPATFRDRQQSQPQPPSLRASAPPRLRASACTRPQLRTRTLHPPARGVEAPASG
jgi:hypothetical protein